MQFEKIQVSQTSAIQWSVLANESSFHTPFREPVEHNASTPLNQIQDRWTFTDILFADKLLLGSKCFPISKKVWYHNKMNETLKTWKANSHLPSRCPPHLGTNGQIFQVPNCPQQELQNQIKFPRISPLEYLRGHQNSHLLRGRASTAQQGRGWLD